MNRFEIILIVLFIIFLPITTLVGWKLLTYSNFYKRLQGRRNQKQLTEAEKVRCVVCKRVCSTDDVYDTEGWWCRSCYKKVMENI